MIEPENGPRRSFRFIKKLQRLEREAIERATNNMEAAGSHAAEEVRDQRQEGHGFTAEEELENIEEVMFQVLPEEADAIPGGWTGTTW